MVDFENKFYFIAFTFSGQLKVIKQIIENNNMSLQAGSMCWVCCTFSAQAIGDTRYYVRKSHHIIKEIIVYYLYDIVKVYKTWS